MVMSTTSMLPVTSACSRQPYQNGFLTNIHDLWLANAPGLVRSKQDAADCWPLEYSYPDKTWLDFGPKKQPNSKAR